MEGGSSSEGTGSIMPNPPTTQYSQADVEAPANAPKNVGGMIDPTSSGGSAHNLAAQLLQAQFQSWQKTFQPIELAAMNQLSFNNPRVLSDAVQKANVSAQGMAGATEGIANRQNAEMGLQPTAGQQKATGRILNLNRAAMVAGAENQARSNIATQDQQILLGTAPNPNVVKQALSQ